MTANQIANKQAKELARSNRAKESETFRSNRAHERETRRSNKAKEFETHRSNVANEGLTKSGHKVTQRGQDLQLAGKLLDQGTARRGQNMQLAGKFISLFNDPAWTNLDPQATADVANISMEVPLGRVGYDPVVGKLSVPGIARVNFCPGIGTLDTNDPFGAANAAFRMIFSYIRSGNAGSTNYEANDLGIYLLAVDSPYMFISMLTRCYGLLNHADAQNRYIGQKIARTMGFTEEVLSQPNRLRAFINVCINQMKVFAVPRVFPLYARHSWLCTHVFKDKDSAKAQYFYYMPEYLFTYLATSGPDGSGMLSAVDVAPALNFDVLQNMWDAMWSSLIKDQDIAIMSGDILKKYDQSQLVEIKEIDESYRIAPAYNEDVSQQFHCTTLMGSPAPKCNNIYQTPDDGGLWWGATEDDISDMYPGWVMSYNGHKVLGVVSNTYDKALYFKRPMTVFCHAPWTYPGGASAFGDYGTKKALNRRIGFEYFFEDARIPSNVVKFASRLKEDKALFNLYTGRDQPEWIMEYTRNIALYANYMVPITKGFEGEALSGDTFFLCNPIATCGTEYFSTCEIFQFDAPGEMAANLIDTWQGFRVVHVTSSNHQGLLQLKDVTSVSSEQLTNTMYIWQAAVAAFDWFPSIYWTITSFKMEGDPVASAGSIAVAARTTDIQNYTYLDGDVLNKMNYVALQSYFGIPTMGKPNY